MQRGSRLGRTYWTLIATVGLALLMGVPGNVLAGSGSVPASSPNGASPMLHAAPEHSLGAAREPSSLLPALRHLPGTFQPAFDARVSTPSVSPTIGVNYGAATEAGAQNEPGIAVNPTNPRDIIVSGNDYNTAATGAGGGSWASEFTSLDGGQTWQYHPAAMNATFAGGKPCFGGDTNVFFGPDGTAYFAGLGYPDAQTLRCSGTSGPATNGGLFVAHSTDGGQTWTFVKVEQDFGSNWVDKEWMGINPANGEISIDVMNYSSTAFIDYWYSTDKGSTWNGPIVVNPSSDQNMVAAGLAVDYQGGVDIVWQGGATQNYIEFSRATAPGSAFSAETNLGSITCAPTGSSNFPAIGGVQRMNCFPQIFADDSPTSPDHGNLYIIYTTNTTSLQIQLLRSTNYGSTWTPQGSAIAVNNDPSDGADHWWPQGTVGKNGTVYVEFLDRRYNTGNLLVDATMAVSTDGGLTFPINIRLSSVSGNPDVWSAFMGDYENTFWSPNGTFAVWTDFRNGASGSTNEDLYVGQLIWLNLTTNVAGVTATVDGSSASLPQREFWNHGTVHNISVPASVTVGPNTLTFQHWSGASASSNPSLTNFPATGTANLEAVYAGSAPLISSFTASPSSIPAGGTTYLNVSAAGGLGPLTYAYSGQPSACPSVNASQLVCSTTVTTTTTYTVTVNVTDSASPHHSTSASTLFTVTVPSPTIGAFTAAPDPVLVSHTTYLNVTASGGTGPLGYAYAGLPTGCHSSNQSSLPCVPSVPGTYSVTVFVNDSHGVSANRATSVTVDPLPSISAFTISPAQLFVGGTTYLNVSASGGLGSLSYAFSGLPSGCFSSSTASLPCVPSVAGQFTISVFANDTVGDSASAHGTLSVLLPLQVTLSAVPSTVVVNHPASISPGISGGSGTYSYVYTGLPAGCSSSNVTPLRCVPTNSGTFGVRVFVNDTARESVSASTTLTVLPPLTLSSYLAAPAAATVGTTVVYLNATASGGEGLLSYVYTGLPSGCASANVSSLTCVPQQSGTFLTSVFVNDSVGDSATLTAAFTAYTPPVISSFTVSPVPVVVNHTVSVTVLVSGGVAPYLYTYAGLPSGCLSENLSEITCSPSVVGNFTLTVAVTDARGQPATASALLQVVPGPSQPPLGTSAGLIGGLELLVVLLVVGVVVVVAVVLSRRSRSKRRHPPVPQTPPGYPYAPPPSSWGPPPPPGR